VIFEPFGIHFWSDMDAVSILDLVFMRFESIESDIRKMAETWAGGVLKH
jgi:hypothetical protein